MKRLFVDGPMHGELRELSPDEHVINALEPDDARHALVFADPMDRLVMYYRTQVAVTRRPGGFSRAKGTHRAVHLFTPGGKEPDPWALVDAMMIAFGEAIGVTEHKS